MFYDVTKHQPQISCNYVLKDMRWNARRRRGRRRRKRRRRIPLNYLLLPHVIMSLHFFSLSLSSNVPQLNFCLSYFQFKSLNVSLEINLLIFITGEREREREGEGESEGVNE